MVDKQTQEIRDWEREEIHSQWISLPPSKEEEEPRYGTEEWYAWLQSQADPVNSSLYY